MVDQNQGPGAEAADVGESDGIDLEGIRDTAVFVLRGVRRRPKLTLATFAIVAGLGLLVAWIMPRMYNAQVKLLAQRGTALRVLSGSHPQMDSVDNPTKNVAAMILRRDNLESLARDANLVARFEQTRPKALRWKDALMARLFGPTSEETKQLVMVFTLEKQLVVEVGSDDSMTISVDWANPQVAYDLVTLVQKNFLEARYDSDVAEINDSIAVLEEHAKDELAHVDEDLADYQKIVAERVSAERAARATTLGVAAARVVVGGAPRMASTPMSASGSEPDPDVTKALEEKRLQIRSIEETQQHTLAALRQQLMQAQLTLTPMHPTVVALQQQIETMSQPPAELAQLKSDERALMAQIVPLRPPTPIGAGSPTPAPAFQAFRASSATTAASAMADGGTTTPPPPLATLDRDGTVQLAQSKLGSAIGAYQDAMSRIDAAKVELDITRAVYKHRYIVVSPADMPNRPKKATAYLIAAGSVGGAAVLALGLAALLDLLGGRVLEAWQVRRRLKLDVLAEFDNPS
jgi:hypothetical protein